MEVPLAIIQFDRILHYKPSIWGYPHAFGNPRVSCSPGAGDKGGVGGFRGVLALDPAQQGSNSAHVQD